MINRSILAICEYFPYLRRDIDEKMKENHRLKVENQDLLMQIYRLKNQINKTFTYSEKKEKTNFTKCTVVRLHFVICPNNQGDMAQP